MKILFIVCLLFFLEVAPAQDYWSDAGASTDVMQLVGRELFGTTLSVAVLGEGDTVLSLAGTTVILYARVDSFYQRLAYLDLPNSPSAITIYRSSSGQRFALVAASDTLYALGLTSNSLALSSAIALSGPTLGTSARTLIYLRDNRCLVITANAIDIFDISIPTQISLDTSIVLSKRPDGFVFSDTLMYCTMLGSFNKGYLDIYSVANLRQPALLSTTMFVDMGDVPQVPYTIAKIGNRVFTVAGREGGRVYTLDVSNPRAPFLRDMYPGMFATSGRPELVTTDSVLFVPTDWPTTVTAYDVSHPDTILPMMSFDTGFPMLEISGLRSSSVYTLYTGGSGGVRRYQINVGSHQLEVSSAPSGGAGKGIDVFGDYLAVSDYASGLVVYDRRPSTDPTFLGQNASRGQGLAIRTGVTDTTAYLAEGHYIDGGMYTIDLGHPANPTITWYTNYGGGTIDVCLSDSTLYLLNNRQNSIQVFDISDPHQPTLVNAIPLGVIPAKLVVRDTVGFLAYWTYTYNQGLMLLNLSNPQTPTIRTMFSLNTYGISSVALLGLNHVVLKNFHDSVYVVDVTDLGQPVCVARVRTARGRHVKVERHLAFVGGLTILDLSQPSMPRIIGELRLSTSTPEDLAVSGNRVYIVSASYGVYVVELDTTLLGVRTKSESLPNEFILNQNYPNPFNPSTVIRYQIPVSSMVSLKVYNVLGQEVATLVNEVKQPGMYSVTWDASYMPSGVSSKGGYASGVYFYRLQAGNFADTKKLILIK